MITVSKEDYLKAILEAEGEGEQVIAARLAHWLSVSAPAVTMALRRLKRDGLVSVRQDGRVQLTSEGRKIARRLAVRHHLIERMLHEVFGMAWYKVHDEAERLEHAVSGDFEALLSRKLGRGGPCPHGNPSTPEPPSLKRKRGLLLLSETQPGNRYTVQSVYERDRKLGEFLRSWVSVQEQKLLSSSEITTTLLAWQLPPGRSPWARQLLRQVWVAPASESTSFPRKKGLTTV